MSEPAAFGLADADALVAAALTAARAAGFGAAAAVVDAGGHLVAFRRDDGVGFLAAEVVAQKAWTAAAHGLSTQVWSTLIADPGIAPLANLPRMMPVAGGLPLRHGDRLVGALAVSGGTYVQDHAAAAAALVACGFPIP